MNGTRPGGIAGWGELGPPPPEAICVEEVVDRLTDRPAIGSVRHSAHAWCARLPRPASDAAFAAIGAAYLADVAAAANLLGDDRWVHHLLLARLDKPRKTGDHGFGWLPETWSGPRDAGDLPPGVGARGSIRVQRSGGKDTLVLLAGNVNTRHQLQFGADFGLRIVVHIAQGVARIHGVTLSGLSGSHAATAVPAEVDTLLKDGGLRMIKEAIADALIGGRAPGTGAVWLHNIEQSRERGVPAHRLSVSGLAAQVRNSRRRLERSRVHDFRVDVDVDIGTDGKRDAEKSVRRVSVVHVHRNDYIGSAADRWESRSVRAFAMDGASQGAADDISRRRPTRTPAELEPLRSDVPLYTNKYVSVSSTDLRVGNPRPWFETWTADVRSEPNAPPPTVPTSGFRAVALPATSVSAAPILSDEQGSIETHLRATELFCRLQTYGFDPEAYFRFARLPLVQRVRPAMTWAPDGDLPNAEVRPFVGSVLATEPGAAGQPDRGGAADVRSGGNARLWNRVQLLVRYGSASPFHREVREAVAEPEGHSGRRRRARRKAQYLSVACDARWAWHEFGHVLSYAGTGELELPFAHGVGDGLAAIATDPASKLAVDPEAAARFVTFPWIEVPGRSHGRLARSEGYCWCGRRNLVRLNFSAPIERYHHSYFGEQLMSSSLFRLYRSLGGDTREPNDPDNAADLQLRLEASDYCIYLVMYALTLLGPDSIAPAQTPEQFVAALIDADLATGDWEVNAQWPFSSLEPIRRKMTRQGGRVHKVIRWAFERQGLYATPEPRKTVEGPGLPPAVDVYIADRRPLLGADGVAGGYAPVPLRLGSDALWHAEASSMALQADGQLKITVRNCGQVEATRLSVRVWTRASTVGAWVPLLAGAEQVKPCGPGGASVSFTFPLDEIARRGALWVLASADAPADPSNLGPADIPPTTAAALRDLVAHDNNLALARLK